MGHRFRVKLSPKKPHPLQLLVDSPKGVSAATATAILGYDPGPRLPKLWTEEEKHFRKVAYSPQGLFARATPPDTDLGSMAGHRFHEHGMMERRGISVPEAAAAAPAPADPSVTNEQPPSQAQPRAQSAGADSKRNDGSRPNTTGSSGSRGGGTSPMPPPPGPRLQSAQPPLSAAPVSPSRRSLRRQTSLPATPQKLTARAASWQDMQERKDKFDLREGMQVAILGVTPSPLGTQKVWPPKKADREPATKDEALKVYADFCELLTMDGKSRQRLQEKANAAVAADGEEMDEWREPAAFSDSIPTGLPPASGQRVGLETVSWRTFLMWAETSSYGVDVRMKCTYEALLKALKNIFDKMDFDQRREGVSLGMIIRWMWPFVSFSGLSEMFTWMCTLELERASMEPPPVIDEKERSDMIRLFKSMDMTGKGYCTAFDIAGGDHQDYKVRLRNTIDEATVKQILGDELIDIPQFLDLMCEAGYRGHEESTKAILEDGRHVVKLRWSAIDFSIWVFEHPTPEDIEQRTLMARGTALETEVIHYREKSQVRSKAWRAAYCASATMLSGEGRLG